MQDQWDQEKVDFEDSELMLLEPGGKFETEYTFCVEPQPWSTQRSDVKFMKDDGTYWMELGHMKCWWMWADDVGDNMTAKEIRELPGQRKYLQWQPACRLILWLWHE
jgi:hypothetical protein